MATFPQGIASVLARCDRTERRVVEQLGRCLADDCLVWHDVIVGAAARQVDFVVLHPRLGLVLLGVERWAPGALVGGGHDTIDIETVQGRVTRAHPLRRLRAQALELVEPMRRDLALVHADGVFAGKLLLPFGWGVVLAELGAADVASPVHDDAFPRHFTLLRDDLETGVTVQAFERRLMGMATLSYPHTLSAAERDRVCEHLFGQGGAARASPPPDDDEVEAAPASTGAAAASRPGPVWRETARA